MVGRVGVSEAWVGGIGGSEAKEGMAGGSELFLRAESHTQPHTSIDLKALKKSLLTNVEHQALLPWPGSIYNLDLRMSAWGINCA